MSRKRSFLLSYVATAVLGTSAVYFGAPIVRASIPEEQIEAMRSACRSERPLSDLWTAIQGQPEPVEVIPDRAPGPQPRIRRGQRSDADRLAGVPPPQTALTPTAPATPREARSPAANGGSASSEDFDFTRMWAIVTNDHAGVYSRSGDKVTELGIGSVVEVADVRSTRSERLAICRFDKQPESLTLALVRASDIQLRTGNVACANPELVGLLVRQARLQQDLAAARASQANEQNRVNPAFDRYDKARRECMAFNERLTDVKARFDKAQGASRTELMDKLRTMKDEGAELARIHEAAKREFESWAAAHPQTSSETPATASLVAELATLRRQILDLERQP
jgi:hypothetical protein